MGPNPKIFEAKYLYDYHRSVEAGMNSGIDPLLLQRNQLAFFRNGTVRGTFPTHRPAYFDLTLSYPDLSIKTPFTTGMFQGAGYFKPDFGTESIVIAVGGRLFQVSIFGSGGAVTEISIAGDTQSSSAPIIWIWQSEKWSVATDSAGLPVFFDGNSTRRSLGAAATVGTINATASAPAPGSTVNLTTLANFTGPFNVPLRLTNPTGGSTGIVQAVSTSGSFTGYPVTVKNLNETAGTVEAANSQVLVQNAAVGSVATEVAIHQAFGSDLSSITITLTAPSTVPVGTGVLVPLVYSSAGSDHPFSPVPTGTITAISGNQITVAFSPVVHVSNLNVFLRVGTQITTSSTGSGTIIALLLSSLTAPAINATATAFLDRAYTGALPQAVIINGKNYQITAVVSNTPSTTVTVINSTFPVGTSNIAVGATLTTLPELPAGRMGAYGLGRNWMSLTDGRSFVAGDLVGGASGLAAYNFRDAVLKMQENTILNGGGSFAVPGQVGDIRAMIFSSVLDTSLGQGPMAVVTPKVVFSCQAPVDRTTWQNLANPILTESMKGGGGLSQWSTTTFNSDVMMRAIIGIRSYIQGRRDFDTWGNVPQSREVDPILATDSPSLLQFASAVEFDNRWLLTASPVQSQFGVYWTEIVALNADPISSLRGKAPSVYDGVWDGMNILQLVTGSFAGVERCFAICVSQDLTQIQIREILKSADPVYQDNGTDRIQWEYFTSEVNFYENDPRRRDFLRLLDGELRCDNLNETLYQQPVTQAHDVLFEVFYRCDQFPTWTPWNSWTEHFDPATDPGYRNGMGLGEPAANVFDETNNRALREGITAQFRVRITGHCRVMLHRWKAVTIPEVDFSKPKAGT